MASCNRWGVTPSRCDNIKGEARYLDLLNDRVELASRKSQELFDRLTSRILAGAHNPVPVDEIAAKHGAAAGGSARTNVIVKMPVGEIGGPADDTEPVIQNPKGKRELILLVDDNEEVLEKTGGILAFEDYRVVVAKDGPEAASHLSPNGSGNRAHYSRLFPSGDGRRRGL